MGKITAPETFETDPTNGWTILHYIAADPMGSMEHIEFCFENEAFRTLRTLDTNQTPYEIALENGRNEDILEALKPKPVIELSAEDMAGLQRGLEAVVLSRSRNLVKLTIIHDAMKTTKIINCHID